MGELAHLCMSCRSITIFATDANYPRCCARCSSVLQQGPKVAANSAPIDLYDFVTGSQSETRIQHKPIVSAHRYSSRPPPAPPMESGLPVAKQA